MYDTCHVVSLIMKQWDLFSDFENILINYSKRAHVQNRLIKIFGEKNNSGNLSVSCLHGGVWAPPLDKTDCAGGDNISSSLLENISLKKIFQIRAAARREDFSSPSSSTLQVSRDFTSLLL